MTSCPEKDTEQEQRFEMEIRKNMKIRGFEQKGTGNFVQKYGLKRAGLQWTKDPTGSIIQKVERFRFHGIERTFPPAGGKKN